MHTLDPWEPLLQVVVQRIQLADWLAAFRQSAFVRNQEAGLLAFEKFPSFPLFNLIFLTPKTTQIRFANKCPEAMPQSGGQAAYQELADCLNRRLSMPASDCGEVGDLKEEEEGNFELMRNGDNEKTVEVGKLLESRRRQFVATHACLTLAVSLLICACMILEARSADSAGASRQIFSPNVKTGSRGPGGGEQEVVTPAALAAAPSDLQDSAGKRETRATTRRRNTSTSSATSSTTSTTTPGPQTETEAALATSTAKPASSSTRSGSSSTTRATGGNTSKRLSDEQDDEAEAAAEEAERVAAAARRRRLRNRKNKSPGQPGSSTTTSTTAASQTPAASSAATTMSGSTMSSTSGFTTRPTPTSSSKRPGAGDSKLEANHTRHRHHKHPNGTHTSGDELDEELEDEDLEEFEDEQPKPPAAGKRVDLSKVHLVNLDHFNETHAAAAASSKHKNDSTTSTTKHHESGTLDKIPAHEHEHESTPGAALDARSPGATPLGKRLTEMIAETRNRLRSSTTPAATSTTQRHFSYAKSSPTSGTTELTPSMTTPTTLVAPTTRPNGGGYFVQVMNQTASGEPGGPVVMLNETAHNLDWSKFVKVMFKSARDNRTIYTLVMNSSELSQHPISDWSSELPGLLRRDFDKLKDKWLHVFPDLMSDLATIITSKNHSLPLPISKPTDFNVTLAQDSLIATANATHPIAQTFNATSSQLNGTMFNQTLSTLPANQTISYNTAITPSAPSNQTNLTPTITTTNWPTPQLASSTNSTISNVLNVTSSQQASVAQASNQTTPAPPLTTGQGVQLAPATSQVQGNDGTNKTSTAISANQEEILVTKKTNARNQLEETPGGRNWTSRNRTMGEMIRDIRDENLKIEDNVREQGSSLKHFIIICSISVVVATSLVVALIILLMK